MMLARVTVISISEKRFPNLVGDESENDAANGFSTFDPLIKIRCSSRLKFFLCSIYFPMCTDKVPIAIGPCRPLCERVQMKCEPLLKEFGFPWPVSMNCSKFPLENNHDAMCMKGPASDEDGPLIAEESESDVAKNVITTNRCVQPSMVYMNRTAQCVPLCHSNSNTGYSKDDREAASTALFIMSLVCTALTSVCLLTFCTRKHCLVALPELSLLFCSVSFSVSAIVYLFSLLYRDQISCIEYNSKLIFVVTGVQHIPCTTVAVLLYYFGTTGRLWWFVLCCTWNKYTQRHQQNSDSLLLRTHMLAWGIPLGAVILALMAQSVRADPLSGICLVGGGNRIIEAVFISLRELILLLCSLVPLFFGCLALIGSAPATDHSVASTGLLGSLYPMAAAFLLLSSLQYLLTPTTTGWNTVTAIKLLADPLLGILASAGCFVQILFNIFKANRLQLLDKHGYQPAAPQIPRPTIPSHVATSSNAYSLSRYPPEHRPLC
uniref:Frizzled-4 n=1 Tax=Setaria digitata TaxID=48799 RepID=A0A915PXL7_9BILA